MPKRTGEITLAKLQKSVAYHEKLVSKFQRRLADYQKDLDSRANKPRRGIVKAFRDYLDRIDEDDLRDKAWKAWDIDPDEFPDREALTEAILVAEFAVK